MRRFETKRNASLFSRNEWLRLISMLGMLVILFFMIKRARDPHVWSWLVNERQGPNAAADNAMVANLSSEPESLFDGPTDFDPDESEAAREVFEALSDRTPITAEEMPAYWRQWRWVRAQSMAKLKERSRNDLTLSHFLEVPEKLRGEVVRLRLHLRRSLSWEIGPEEKAGGAKKVYEAWGWTDESPNFYCIVFTQPPADMPIGPNVQDEVTFYGYFLKLISYRDQQDKLRMAPLLIGRVDRHAVLPVTPDEGPWTIATVILGGLCIVFIVVRWTRRYALPPGEPKQVNKEAGRAALNEFLESSDGEIQEDQSAEEADLPVIRIKRE